MATITSFSKRVYKHTLNPTVVQQLQTLIKAVTDAKIKAYAVLSYQDVKDYQNAFCQPSLHLALKADHGLDTYYTNFAVTEAQAAVKSNTELQTYYLQELQENIAERHQHLDKLNQKLTFWLKVKAYLIDCSKTLKQGKKPHLKTFSCYQFEQVDGQYQVRCHYKQETQIWSFYLFEVKVVDKKIKQLKNQRHLKQHGLANQKRRLEKLKQAPYRSCFGSKALFLSQYTTYQGQHDLWKQIFHQQRYHSVQMQGLRAAPQGNYCVRYEIETQTLSVRTHLQNEVAEGKKNAKGTWFEVPKVVFTYHGEKYVTALNTPQTKMAYRIEDNGDYYIIKATFDYFQDEEDINYSKADGVVGYDLNVDHIAYVETDKHGNLHSQGILPFDLDGKTSGQRTKLLEATAIQLVDIAKQVNKPLVGEDIKRLKKSNMTYRNKRCNQKVSEFAYKKLDDAIQSRAYKLCVDVTKVDPAYTSQIGKLKYMKAKGLSIHIAAAYVVARRGQGFNEKQKQFRPYRLKWWAVCGSFKKTPKRYFYQTPPLKLDHYPTLKLYAKAIETLSRYHETQQKKLASASLEKPTRQMG